MPDTQQQFDGQNAVPGYTLFQGKDGKSFYLKGEDLADDEIKARVAKLRGQSTPNISSESEMAAHPPSAKPMAMESDSPVKAAVTNFAARAGNPYHPSIEQLSQANRDAAKFGADTLAGQQIVGAGARLAENEVLPALKALPYAGKMISAVDESPGVLGKVVRGAAVGGALGGGEGLLRGHGTESLKDAAGGAVMGGLMGAALPAIHKLSGYEPPVEPELGSPENPGPMSKIPNRLPANLRGDPFAPKAVPVPEPEPELGSPENPGFMSKLPSRLPQSLRGDPFSPHVEEAAEAGRQAAGASSGDVAIVPEPRAAMPSDRPGSAWSLTRTEGLPEAAQRGQPGALDVMRQLKPTLVIPRSGGFETPNMQALRDSLGISDAFSPNAPEVPQGNPTPFSPSVTQGWLRPRKVLQ